MLYFTDRKALGPVVFSELLEKDSSFTESVDQIIQQLSSLNDSTPIEVKNFEQLLHSLKKKAQGESNNSAGKVAIVESLVSQFISGNSLRAQQALTNRPSKPNPATLRAKEVLENFEKRLKTVEASKQNGLSRGKGEREETTTKQPVVATTVKQQQHAVVDNFKVVVEETGSTARPQTEVTGRPVTPSEELQSSTIRNESNNDFDVGYPSTAVSRITTAATTATTSTVHEVEDVETFENTLLPRPTVSSLELADALELKKLLRIAAVGEVKAALVVNARSDPDQMARVLASLFEYQHPGRIFYKLTYFYWAFYVK